MVGSIGDYLIEQKGYGIEERHVDGCLTRCLIRPDGSRAGEFIDNKLILHATQEEIASFRDYRRGVPSSAVKTDLTNPGAISNSKRTDSVSKVFQSYFS